MRVVTSNMESLGELAAIRNGDARAFERYFRAWYPRLSEHAAHLLHNRDAAEDAVQEVFIALWRGRAALPDADRIGAYLHRAVRNRALNQLRGPDRTEVLRDEDDSRLATAPMIPSEFEAADLANAVDAVLATLGRRARETFLLSRESGLTYSEIAEATGVSIKTVETVMGHALKVLRERLALRRLSG